MVFSAAQKVLSRLFVVGSVVALLLTAGSGIWLTAGWAGSFGGSYDAARTTHVAAGMALVLAAIYEAGRRMAARLARRGRILPSVPAVRLTAPDIVRPRWLGWVYWALLAILLVTGIQVWLHGHYHLSPVPLGSPLRWRIMHGIAPYYFYAVFLLIYAGHAVSLLLRLRAYLLHP